MNGITYFRLTSPYDGDITKNCALTGNEVDNNFYTLEGRDVKSVELQDGKIIVNLMNGDKLSTDNITEGYTKDLTIEFDETNGILTITRNGVAQEITGFLTTDNVNNSIAVDGTIVGNGLFDKPVGLSPMEKTGQYKPVKKIINKINNEALPQNSNIAVGDRYLTIENVNDFGYLYNYQGLKEIACRLNEMNSQWRVPTKEDWDDMLDSVEPCEEFRNHTDARSNKFLGKFAGKFLKTSEFWKKEESNTDCDCDNNVITEHTCNCGRNIPCTPNYCGEFGSCHYRHGYNNEGIGKYGFNVLPTGYANEAEDYLYFKERAYFWTATNHEYRDAYIKAFAYNKSTVLQDVMASDNYMSVRLVKNYNGHNYSESEEILGNTYPTVLMPSLKHGKTIWTSVNFAMVDCDCDCSHGCKKYIKPNDGEGIENKKKYILNEWDGTYWLRKELLDGESVVVINSNAEDAESADYTEYRLVNGELTIVSSFVYEKVIETIQPIIDEIKNSVDDLDTKIDNEIERSTTRDEEIQSQMDRLQEKDAELEGSINELNQEDTRLQGEIDALSDMIEIGGGDIIIQEGSEFDTTTGMLTLKSKSGHNDIQIKIEPNFGTF